MRWFVRNPSGLLNYFDREERRYLALHLTAGEAFLLLRRDQPELGEDEAHAAVSRGTEDHLPFTNGVKGDGLARWREAESLINRASGRRS